MRINKYIAHSGIASRRKADELILEGKVKINGRLVTEPGAEVGAKDKVEVNGKNITLEKNKIYIMMNKPSGYICSSSDDRGRKTVLDLIKNQYTERLYTIGRLDYETEGLLLLTNDGDIANNLIHPRSNINKVYYVELNGPLTLQSIRNLESGVVIDGYKTRKAKIKKIGHNTSTNRCLITISEGRNRQVRKMFETQRLAVTYLKRLSVGELHIGDLKPGEFRTLNHKEIAYLKSL